ncbi:MAG: YciI family protein [Salinimicrobium sp.]
MRKIAFLTLLLGLASACKDYNEDIRGIPDPAEVEAVTEEPQPSVEEQAKQLKQEGYQTFFYEEEDTTYLMQQYYLVLLKSGKKRSQDSTEAAQLQEQHLAHLSRMAGEGYLSLVGPLGDDGNIRGIAIYNTPTQQMADSLANMDPMVKAGRLEVEIHPWWAAKGGKLK